VLLPLQPVIETTGTLEQAVVGQLVERRVVIVDDNEDAARALAELLALRGCDARVAHNGRDGLSAARELRPDALLLDLDLPDRSGYEVAEQLRGEPALDGMLIVAISGFGDEQARERCRQSGIDHHLLKPVDLEALLGLLAAHAVS
jgi:CheY-like chemotaxis protein